MTYMTDQHGNVWVKVDNSKPPKQNKWQDFLEWLEEWWPAILILGCGMLLIVTVAVLFIYYLLLLVFQLAASVS